MTTEAHPELETQIAKPKGEIFRAAATLCVTVVGLLSAVVLVQTVAGWL